MQKIEFEERAVAFLDILGFKEFIKGAEIVGSDEYTKLCDLQGVIESQMDISSETASGEERKFLPEMQLKCTYISDSIILSAPISNESFSGLTVVAMKTIQIAHKLLKMGFLMRGGIAVGLASHTERNIFGTGYQIAYEIQEKHACTPRVLLHESAADLLDGAGRGESIYSCWVKENDHWIVNTLYPHWSYIGGRSQCHNELFLGYRKTIIENLNEHPLGSSVRGKWEWMAGYFNETVKHCSDIRGVESIDLPFPPSPFRSGVAADETNPHDVWKPFKAPSFTGIIKVQESNSVGTKCPRCGFEFRFSFPCAPPRYFADKRRFRRALSELRGEARGVCLTRASCAAPLVGEISREPEGRQTGGDFFGLPFLARQER